MNAKTHLIAALEHYQLSSELIRCAEIIRDERFPSGEDARTAQRASLAQSASREQWEQFWKDLDFDFHYGCGEIIGTIWLFSRQWMELEARDGSDRWVLKSCPEIPPHLREIM